MRLLHTIRGGSSGSRRQEQQPQQQPSRHGQRNSGKLGGKGGAYRRTQDMQLGSLSRDGLICDTAVGYTVPVKSRDTNGIFMLSHSRNSSWCPVTNVWCR